MGPTEDFQRDDCVADLEKQAEYLGNMVVKIYIQQGIFNREEFDDNVIEHSAQFFTK